MRNYTTLFFCVFAFFKLNAQNDSLFYSSKEFNQYRFSNTNLINNTSGFLLDMEEEWTSSEIDSFLNNVELVNSNVDKLLNYFNLLERTDVSYSFERDDLLFPIMNHYSFNGGSNEMKVPLFIMNHDFSRLNNGQRGVLDNWTNLQPYNSIANSAFEINRVSFAGFFADTLRSDHLSVYWNDQTFIRNTNVDITTVRLHINGLLVDLQPDILLNLNDFLLSGSINQIGLDIEYSDGDSYSTLCEVFFDNAPTQDRAGDPLVKTFGDWQGEYGNEDHKVNWTVLYGCEDRSLNRPFIFVAGWGTYTGKDWLNNLQGWPTDENGLYQQWNQANIIDDLRLYGYDVVIVRFTPPNASTQQNADKLKYVINWVNDQKALANSSEENIILGYSAGSMCVRLALEQMEKAHLEQQGRHPHTKLYVSYDGEHQGANIPLAAQHATEYLDEYQSNAITFNIYALHYILNAPLSKELLHYFWEQTGNSDDPGQGPHGSRWNLLQAFDDANHFKTPPERPGYPTFSRCISISNGRNESNYNASGASHFPYPTSFSYQVYRQANLNRKWEANFNAPGGNTVFKYSKRIWPGPWSVLMEGVTDASCLVLDNAPGGLVFIETNPLTEVMKQMKDKINIGDPEVYNPHTQFAFTPTVFTHDIRNFNVASNGYKMEYNMKNKNLLFQSKEDYDSSIIFPNNTQYYSDYFGYPHIAYPYTHYWEATPFDAVFSCNYNTEHILFNNCYRSDPTNNNEAWTRINDPSTAVVKNFILDEADYFDAYIQNKRYGYNARNDFEYTAEIIVPNVIYVGKEVTQRTNFNDAEFLDNSNLHLQAGQEIVIAPGTWVRSGAEFHAHIAPFHCNYFKSTKMAESHGDGSEEDEREGLANQLTDEKDAFVVYPNPSAGMVNIRQNTPEITNFEYSVFDINGTLVVSGTSRERITTFEAQTGLYILKLTNHETTTTHKILVR